MVSLDFEIIRQFMLVSCHLISKRLVFIKSYLLKQQLEPLMVADNKAEKD